MVARQVQGRIRSQQAAWLGEDGLDFGNVEELRRCLEGEVASFMFIWLLLQRQEGVQHGRGILTDQSGVARAIEAPNIQQSEAYVGHFVKGKLDRWEKAKAVSAADTGST